MDINENGVPEKMDADLSDIAYNKVPDGAEYDVFSENVKNSHKGVLLYSDVSSPKSKGKSKNEAVQDYSPKQESKNEKSEQEPENDGMEYDVFSENANSDSSPKKPINREYLDRIYNGGLEFSEDTILMKRSDYIAAYNRIEENFRKEKKECLKDCLIVLIISAFLLFLYNFISYLQDNIMSVLFTNLLSMAEKACELYSKITCAFLFIAIIKKYIKAKKAKQNALDRLEERKQELMLMGLYDLSN